MAGLRDGVEQPINPRAKMANNKQAVFITWWRCSRCAGAAFTWLTGHGHHGPRVRCGLPAVKAGKMDIETDLAVAQSKTSGT